MRDRCLVKPCLKFLYKSDSVFVTDGSVEDAVGDSEVLESSFESFSLVSPREENNRVRTCGNKVRAVMRNLRARDWGLSDRRLETRSND